MRLHAITIVAVLLLLMTAGCQRQIVDAPNPLPIASQEYDRMYEASIAVLRDYGFRVDRQDYRFGRVTTLPLDSPTAVEIWRPQNTTTAQAWQSTLDHLRRTVNVFIEPVESPDEASGDYALRIEVLQERRVLPARRLTGSTRRDVFSSLDDVPEEWRARGITGAYWQSIGRDAFLEERLMRDIVDTAMAVR